MEELFVVIEKYAKTQFNDLNIELNEYMDMYYNLPYGKKRNDMYISNKRFPTSISEEKDKLIDIEYITRLLSLADFMKENNFNFFRNYEETTGYHHHNHGYRLKEIISNIEYLKEFIPQVLNLKNLLSEKPKELADEETQNSRRMGDFLLEIDQGNLDSILKTELEKRIIQKNLISLRNFDKSRDFKFSIITMGSILEFFLARYCETKGIKPTNNQGEIIKIKNARFVNYVETAIHNDIFSEKDRWKIVQDYLRDFRNYIHIDKEITSKEIDEDWYKTMVPVFFALLENFSDLSSYMNNF